MFVFAINKIENGATYKLYLKLAMNVLRLCPRDFVAL